MPHRASVLVASLVLALACAGCGGGGGGYQGSQPVPPTPGIDLGKQSFAWQPHPAVSGTPVTTTLTIKNFGTDDAGSFKVWFSYSMSGGTGFSEEKFVDHLTHGTTVTLQSTYTPSVWGQLEVDIAIDPEHHVDDAKPDNNEWSESITVEQPGTRHKG